MTITSILLLFYSLISLNALIIPVSSCLHYLETSQLIYDAIQLTSFPVIGISIERHFGAIDKILFFCQYDNYTFITCLAMIFFICMVYLIFFTLYYFSTRVCATLVDKGFSRLVVYLRAT